MAMPHVHAAGIDFIAFFAMFLLASALARLIAVRFPESPWGKAFAVIS